MVYLLFKQHTSNLVQVFSLSEEKALNDVQYIVDYLPHAIALSKQCAACHAEAIVQCVKLKHQINKQTHADQVP